MATWCGLAGRVVICSFKGVELGGCNTHPHPLRICHYWILSCMPRSDKDIFHHSKFI